MHGPPTHFPLTRLIARELPNARAKLSSGEGSALQQLSSNHLWFSSICQQWPWMPVEKTRAWLERVWPTIITLMANCAHRIDELAQAHASHQADVEAARAAGLPAPPAGRPLDRGLVAPWQVALSVVQATCADVIKAKRPYVRPSEAEEAEKKERKEQREKEKAENKSKKGASASAAAAAASSSPSTFISSVQPLDSSRRTALSLSSLLSYLPELLSLSVRVLAAGTSAKDPSARSEGLGEDAAFELIKALLDIPAVRAWLATPVAKDAAASLQTATFVALLCLERPFQPNEYQVTSYLKDVATREAETAAMAAGIKKKRKDDRWGTKWYDELVDPRIEPDGEEDNDQIPLSFGVKLLFPLLSSAPAAARLPELIWDHCTRGMRRAPTAFAQKTSRSTADNELRACLRGVQALLDVHPAFLEAQRGERAAELLSLIEPVLFLPAAQEATWLLSQRGAVKLLLRLVSLLAEAVKVARSGGAALVSALESNCSSIRRLMLRVLRAPTADITRTAQRGVLAVLALPATGACIVPDAMTQKLASATDASQHLLVSLLELIESTLFASPADRAQRASLSHAEFRLVESAFAAIGVLAQVQLHPASALPDPLLHLLPVTPFRPADSSPAALPPLGVRVAQMLIRACETSTPVSSWQMRGASLASICPHLSFLVSRSDLLHLAPLLHTLLCDSMRLVLRDSGGDFEEPCLQLRKHCFLAWSALVEVLGEEVDPALDDIVAFLADVMHSEYWAEKKTEEQLAEEKAEEALQEKKDAEREAARAARYAAQEAKEAAEAAAAGDAEMKDEGDDMKDEDGDGEDDDDDGEGEGEDGEEAEEDEEADDAPPPAAAPAGGAPGLEQPEDSDAPDTDYSSCGDGWPLSDTAESSSESESPWDGPEDKDWKMTSSSHEADFIPLYVALLHYGPKRFLYFHDKRLAAMLFRCIRNTGRAETVPLMTLLLRALADRRKREQAESSSSSSAAAAASSSFLSSLPLWDAALFVNERAVFRRSELRTCHQLREFAVLFDLLGESVFDVPAMPDRPPDEDEDENDDDDDDDDDEQRKLTPKQQAAKAKKKAAKEARAIAKKLRFEERLATFAEASVHTAASSAGSQTCRLLRFLRSLIRLLEGRQSTQYDRYDRTYEGCAELEVRDHHPPPPTMEAQADEGEPADAGKPTRKTGQRAIKTSRKANRRLKKGARKRAGSDSDDDAASSPKAQPGPRLPFRFAPLSQVRLHLAPIASFPLPHSHTLGRCPGEGTCTIEELISLRCLALQVLAALCRCERTRPFVQAAMEGRDMDGTTHGNGTLRELLHTLEATEAFAPAVKQFWKEAGMDGARKANTDAAAALTAKRR